MSLRGLLNRQGNRRQTSLSSVAQSYRTAAQSNDAIGFAEAQT